MASEKFPKLIEGEYALIHCEVETGIITLADGRRRISDESVIKLPSGLNESTGKGEMWFVFKSLAEAKDYALNKINEIPKIECEIVDHNHQRVERLWNEAYVDACVAKSKKAKAEYEKKWHKKILEKISKWF